MSDRPHILIAVADGWSLDDGWTEVCEVLLGAGARVSVAVPDDLVSSPIDAVGAEVIRAPLTRGALGLAASAALLGGRMVEGGVHLVIAVGDALGVALRPAAAAARAQLLIVVGSPLAPEVRALSRTSAAVRGLLKRVGAGAAPASDRWYVALDRAVAGELSLLGVDDARVLLLAGGLGADASGLALDEDPEALRTAARSRLGLSGVRGVVLLVASTGSAAEIASIGAVATAVRRAAPGLTLRVGARRGGLAARAALEALGLGPAVVLGGDRALWWHASEVTVAVDPASVTAVQEAMACRSVAAAIELPVFVDVIGEGGAGLLARDPASLAVAVVRAMESADVRAPLAAQGRGRAVHGFGRDASVHRLMGFVERVLNGGAEPARLEPDGQIVARSAAGRRTNDLLGAARPAR